MKDKEVTLLINRGYGIFSGDNYPTRIFQRKKIHMRKSICMHYICMYVYVHTHTHMYFKCSHMHHPSGAQNNQLHSFISYLATENSLPNCFHFIKQRIAPQKNGTCELEILPGFVFWVTNFDFFSWLIVFSLSHLTAAGPSHLCLIPTRSEGTINYF